jgi:hypothetical protein
MNNPLYRMVALAALGCAASTCLATPPPSGWVSVASTPTGATITIDGQVIHTPTNATFALSPGSHVIVISDGPSHLNCRLPTTVVSGQTVKVSCPS